MTTTTTTTEAPATLAVAIPSDGLRQLANVALFAATDKMANRVLAGVRLESTGTVLIASATDRYTAAREVIELVYDPPRDPFAVTVDLAQLKAALKIPHGPYSQPMVLTVNGESVTFDNGEGLARVALVDGDYPDLERFFDAEQWGATAEPLDAQPLPVTFGAKPAFLARLGKIRTELRKPSTARFTLVDPRKPILVQVDETFQAVIMPVAVSP
jgi:hypothetical protein